MEEHHLGRQLVTFSRNVHWLADLVELPPFRLLSKLSISFIVDQPLPQRRQPGEGMIQVKGHQEYGQCGRHTIFLKTVEGLRSR